MNRLGSEAFKILESITSLRVNAFNETELFQYVNVFYLNFFNDINYQINLTSKALIRSLLPTTGSSTYCTLSHCNKL